MLSELISQSFKSFCSHRLEMEVPKGCVFLNPSIVVLDGKYIANVRCVKYTTNTAETTNIIIELRGDPSRADLTIETIGWLDADSIPVVSETKNFLGVEDIRLFTCGGRLFGVAAIRQLSADDRSKILHFEVNLTTRPSIVSPRIIPSPEAGRDERNWTPIIIYGDTDGLSLIYSFEPVKIIDCNGNIKSNSFLQLEATGLCRNLRGGSQAIPFGLGYITIAHETEYFNGRKYFHRFVYLDKHFNVVAMTRRFHFFRIGKEFAAGIADSFDGRKLIVSFGSDDTSAHFGSVSKWEVAASLITISAEFDPKTIWHLF